MYLLTVDGDAVPMPATLVIVDEGAAPRPGLDPATKRHEIRCLECGVTVAGGLTLTEARHLVVFIVQAVAQEQSIIDASLLVKAL